MRTRESCALAGPATPIAAYRLQAKPRLGAVNDPLEREADQVADAVVAGRTVLTIAGASAGTAQRKCAQCEAEEDKTVRRKLAAGGARGHQHAESARTAVVAVQRGGAPLSAEERGYFEPRFGRDFSDVRIHADAGAAEAARAIDARAFTTGRDIAFAAGEFRPGSQEGRRLLAHELTHVVHQSDGAASAPPVQRKGAAETDAAPSFPGSVTFRGCDDVKGRLNFVEQSTKNAFFTVRDDNCIKNQSLKRDILASFEGLTVDCRPEKVEGQCAEAKKGEGTIILSKLGLDVATGCPPLEAAIFHEVVHLAEGWNLFHGNLSYDCGKACFPNSGDPRGDPSGCGNETGLAPFLGVSSGAALTGKGAATGYARLYAGIEKRGPILSFVRPSLGVGLSIIGDPESGAPGGTSSGTAVLASLMGALRFDPGQDGGLYVSIGGGSGVVFGRGGKHLGHQVGAKFGYRWSIYDLSFDAGIDYDPTREAGEQKLYTLGASFQIAPRIR